MSIWVQRLYTILTWPFQPFNEFIVWFTERSKCWSFFQFARALEPVAILAAVIGLFVALNDRQEERITRAWQLLTTKAPGNSGKIEALQYLNRQIFPNWLLWFPLTKEQVSLQGIDLMPPILAEKWKQTPKEKRESVDNCTQLTYLQKVKLPDAILVNATLVCSDLRAADLRGAYLREADLQGASLWEADLQGADLQEVNLRGADLREADLRGANLWETDLQGASLWKADLRGAVLQDADLWNADLRGAVLKEADRHEAVLWRTDRREAELRKTIEIHCLQLKQAKHWDEAYRDEDLSCGAAIPTPPTLAGEYPAVMF